MVKTPEGAIKEQISAVLNAPDIYSFMPVQQGFGKAGLDYHCAIRVRAYAIAFFIEAKALGKEPTPRQRKLISELRAIDAKVFEISSWAGVRELEQWLDHIRGLR